MSDITNEKVYYPETIADTQLPDNQSVFLSTGSTPDSATRSGVLTPQTAGGTQPPKRVIAHETISQSLNTKSRRILKEFGLSESGGFKIGKFAIGENGDISITPAGIVARDSAGNTSFALDGETGDATFRGEIQGGSININNNFEVDSDGNAIARSIAFLDTGTASLSGGSQQFTVLNQTDAVTGVSLSITVDRFTYVLILVQFAGFSYRASGAGDWAAGFDLSIHRDSSSPLSTVTTKHEQVGGDDVGDALGMSHFLHYLEGLTPGTGGGATPNIFNLNLKGKLSSTTNNGAFQLSSFRITILDLGGALS
jgi:hypothetical protein